MTRSLLARLHTELDLLSRTGVGLPSLAPALAPLLRQLVGAQACVIGWVDDLGQPEGVFHEHASAAATELFINEYERLFTGQYEFNVVSMASGKGPVVGNLLNLDSSYLRSNTYNLLMRPDSYHHALDLRVEVDGVPRAIVGLLRPASQPFRQNEAFALLDLLPSLQRAAAQCASAGPAFAGACSSGHLLVSADGERIELCNEVGMRLLKNANLMGQSLLLVERMVRPPLFIQRLCSDLHARLGTDARIRLEVPGGQLLAAVSWLGPCVDPLAACVAAPGPALASAPVPGQPQESGTKFLVTLEFTPTGAVDVVRSILDLGLSPLQGRLALIAAAGGSRAACGQQHRLGKETLKTHLRKIYAAAQCDDWDSLGGKLRAASLQLQ